MVCRDYATPIVFRPSSHEQRKIVETAAAITHQGNLSRFVLDACRSEINELIAEVRPDIQLDWDNLQADPNFYAILDALTDIHLEGSYH